MEDPTTPLYEATIARLEAENARLREALEDLVSWQGTVDNIVLENPNLMNFSNAMRQGHEALKEPDHG